MEITNHNRNFGIDLLRGLSILVVVIHHLAMGFRLPLEPSLLGSVLHKRIIDALSFRGYEAVFIFFVLSGFLITRRCLVKYGRLARVEVKQFYRRRFCRIFPLLACLLLVLTIAHLLQIPGYIIAKEKQTLGGALFAALTFHLNWYEGQTGWLPGAWDVLWSLSIEEVFYLFFPVCVLFLSQRQLVLALLLLAFSLPYTRELAANNPIWQEKAYLPGMSAIAFGMLTALFIQSYSFSMSIARLLLGFGFLGLIGVFCFQDLLWPFAKNGAMLLLCLSVCCLLAANAKLPFRPIWGLHWLSRMGRLSYEIYLSHMFFVLIVCKVYKAQFGDDMTWSFIVYIPVILTCMSFASFLEKWISKPAAKFLNIQFNGRPEKSMGLISEGKRENMKL